MKNVAFIPCTFFLFISILQWPGGQNLVKPGEIISDAFYTKLFSMKTNLHRLLTLVTILQELLKLNNKFVVLQTSQLFAESCFVLSC